ncbi:hypothetical protein [Clostridium hydrogeniformans]|uniref:hypothetical protein n=1 Tax=Clostridium hydrogeniformans TaxID=349933 RepID=UPI0004805089|nr:hypothetical protein [Clostridium hydrogeniformans]
MTLFIFINFILGFIFIFLGYEIKYNKRLDLINDLNIKNIADKLSYSKWIGFSELITGLLFLITSFIVFITKSILLGSAINVLLIVSLIILLIYGDRKYGTKLKK